MSSTFPVHDTSASAASGWVDEWLRRARPVDPGHHDELRQPDGQLRPAWRALATQLGAPFDELSRCQEALARQIREDGITYNVYNAAGGSSRPWSLEALPLLISPEEWPWLERGIAQRADLLNRILVDTYGEQTLLREAMLPSALVLGHPGYLRGLQGTQPLGGVYLHVVAFDLARGPDGAWWVVGQRTQAPSGLGYVMQNRLIVSRLFPEAYRALNVQHLASTYRRLLDTMSTLAQPCAGGDTPSLALLTPGPYNETYFEHAYLARYLGLPLVEGCDLTVRDDRLFLKTVQGLSPIHGLLRRLDDDFCDPLELRTDSTLGIPGLTQVVRAGNVVLANALGTGFLESPAVHGFLPALSQHLLGENLILPSLPSWWCGEASAWAAVRPQLAQQVIRPTYPALDTPGGLSARHKRQQETVLGFTLSPQEVRAWEETVAQDPAAHTVQTFIPYGQTPVWSEGGLSLRSASVRVYALSDGRGGWHVLPGGMSRIATRDDGPVSLQQGGSSLDTWVISNEPVDAFSMLPTSIKLDELAQRQSPVASRTGENLFWMGRYTERCEQQLRLTERLISLRAEDDEPEQSLLQALSTLGVQFGMVPHGTPPLDKLGRVFERVALDALGDAHAGQGACSLAFNLAELTRTAQALRERLSPAHARLLRAMATDFQQALGRSAQIDPGALAARVSTVQDALAHLSVQLGAVTGAQSDRMTRDAGWRLLTVGRLLERLIGHVHILKAFWLNGALQHPQGFDQALEMFDSTITFRARFQRRLEVPALVALLVMDESNPRALACVVRRLRTELGKLPERAGAPSDLLALLPPLGVGATLASLCDPVSGHGAVLALLDQLLDAGWRLSDEVGRLYFAHAESTDSMVSA